MANKDKRLMLCILDGWGCGISDSDDAIYLANTPFFDSLIKKYPNCRLNASGAAVGLPDGQAGNSEVGHTVIGCGRVIKTDLVRIDEAISSGKLRQEVLVHFEHQPVKAIHVLGILSDGGVHGHSKHFEYIVQTLAMTEKCVYLHCILDGRDVAPASAAKFIAHLESSIADRANIKIATISGRFYAMDRDSNWERTKKAYDAITWARGEFFESAQKHIEQCYSREVTDEFIEPAVNIGYNGASEEDGMFICNFRADRIRQISHMLLDRNFKKVKLRRQLAFGIGMVEYSAELGTIMTHIFEPIRPTNTLGSVLSAAGYRQLRISETEKYAHVTFFFNGGSEAYYNGEERLLIPSPKVTTYDLMPEMASTKMTEQLKSAIPKYDFIVANYPGADMVGHTGSIAPTIKAVEAIDRSLHIVVNSALEQNMMVVITADHGNAEKMFDKDKGIKFTAHTTSPVPFIVVADHMIGKPIKDGALSDAAPTILGLLGVAKPDDMSGGDLLA